MRRIPPNEWIELHELVSFEGAVVIEHGHPTLYDGAHCDFQSIDYDPFEDLLEIQVSSSGRPFRLLIDDPQEVVVDLGRSIEITSLYDRVQIRLLTEADLEPEGVPRSSRPARPTSTEARRGS